MRLRCLGRTWKCYILWLPQLDDTQAERWMYIDENTDKQKLYRHWSQMYNLVTG